MNVETPEIAAPRIRRALPYVPAKDIIIAPRLRDEIPPAISPSARCGPWLTGPRSSVRKWWAGLSAPPVIRAGQLLQVEFTMAQSLTQCGCASGGAKSRAAELGAGFACSARPPSYRGRGMGISPTFGISGQAGVRNTWNVQGQCQRLKVGNGRGDRSCHIPGCPSYQSHASF